MIHSFDIAEIMSDAFKVNGICHVNIPFCVGNALLRYQLLS